MFCSKCGASVAEGSRFCAQCAAPVNAPPPVYYMDPPPATMQAPITLQRPTNPLRPALRHPFFYICAIVFVVSAFFTVYKDLGHLSAYSELYGYRQAYWLFADLIPFILYLSYVLLVIVGLSLLIAAGLRKNSTCSVGGFSVMRAALIVSLVHTVYSIVTVILSSYAYFKKPGGGLAFHLSTSFSLIIPIGVIVCIFAIKINQTALSMARGEENRVSGALSVMIFVQAGVLLLLKAFEYVTLGLHHHLVNALFSTLLTLIPGILFGILLLVIPQKKK